jgi:hypothetical protein
MPFHSWNVALEATRSTAKRDSTTQAGATQRRRVPSCRADYPKSRTEPQGHVPSGSCRLRSPSRTKRSWKIRAPWKLWGIIVPSIFHEARNFHANPGYSRMVASMVRRVLSELAYGTGMHRINREARINHNDPRRISNQRDESGLRARRCTRGPRHGAPQPCKTGAVAPNTRKGHPTRRTDRRNTAAVPTPVDWVIEASVGL